MELYIIKVILYSILILAMSFAYIRVRRLTISIENVL
jgi:hypothetical protein